ncbi:hypothetical protein C2845_PM10G19210 [Panicum miliaceum]|uniref:Uncharacterized protein n=1 Tax=Panicum miliaceum TaxID=4540 RepID=A0A3L6PEP1_PANMI|nr:hypothetical protein C2845_PM10G19210 [Panicum miliaceum]
MIHPPAGQNSASERLAAGEPEPPVGHRRDLLAPSSGTPPLAGGGGGGGLHVRAPRAGERGVHGARAGGRGGAAARGAAGAEREKVAVQAERGATVSMRGLHEQTNGGGRVFMAREAAPRRGGGRR